MIAETAQHLPSLEDKTTMKLTHPPTATTGAWSRGAGRWRGAGIVGEGKASALRWLLALALATPLLGGPAVASDEFNLKVLVSCSTEAGDVAGLAPTITDACEGLSADIGPFMVTTVTVRDTAGLCPDERLIVGPTDTISTKLPWCAGQYVVVPGDDCVLGSAEFVIPPPGPEAVRGETVHLALRPRPCGAPQRLHVDRDGSLDGWQLSETLSEGVRVWWYEAESGETWMVEATLDGRRGSSIQTRSATPAQGAGALSPLMADSLVSSDERSSARLTRHEAREVQAALGTLTSTVEHRCYGSCPGGEALQPVVLQIFDEGGARWMERRVPSELLQGVTQAEGLALLLEHVATQDAAWDVAASEGVTLK
jgi:hypothetical protein